MWPLTSPLSAVFSLCNFGKICGVNVVHWTVYAIIPTLGSYFLLFCHPYILLHFSCLLLLVFTVFCYNSNNTHICSPTFFCCSLFSIRLLPLIMAALQLKFTIEQQRFILQAILSTILSPQSMNLHLWLWSIGSSFQLVQHKELEQFRHWWSIELYMMQLIVSLVAWTQTAHLPGIWAWLRAFSKVMFSDLLQLKLEVQELC